MHEGPPGGGRGPTGNVVRVDVLYVFVAVFLILVSVNRLWVSVVLYLDSSRSGQDGMNWMFIGLILGVIALVIWFVVRPSRRSHQPYYPYYPAPPGWFGYPPAPYPSQYPPPQQPAPDAARQTPLAGGPPPSQAPFYPPGWTPAPYPYAVPASSPGYQPYQPKTFDAFGIARPFITFFAALLFSTCIVMILTMSLAIFLDLDMLHLDSLLLSPLALVASVAIQDVTLVYFVYIQMFKPGHISWRDIGLIRDGAMSRALIGLLAGAGIFGIAIGLDLLLQYAGLLPSSGDSGGAITASGGVQGYILLLIATVVIAPPSEELFFRGYMQSTLVRKWGPVAGIIVSSLFFAAMHLEPLQFLSLFLAGVFLGLLFRKYGLVAAISCHAMNNLLAVTALFMFS